ncbi:MAG: glycosyltransferase [Calditrichaeota bacterium]|nr:MAG: glycosyltransferase [Calditrichota bacterium]
MQEDKTYSICYIAGREITYSRTHVILHTLQKMGHDVHAILPPDKSFLHYPKLLLQFLFTIRKCDLVVVGFYGHFLILFVRLITRKPILFDALVSTFFVMRDRGQSNKGGFKDQIFFLLDKVAMSAADKIILESNDHTLARARVFRLPESRFKRIYLPTIDATVYPQKIKKSLVPFLVHFHGEFAPFHGVKYILEAAKILENEAVIFRIIGDGITAAEDKRLAAELDLQNCEFIERVPFVELPERMSEAGVCLGIFGDTVRTHHELTNKVIEAMAAGCALITAKNAPVQELLQHEKSALLVPPADAKALAAAILQLKTDSALRDKLGHNARKIYLEKCSLEIFQREFNQVLNDLMQNKYRNGQR